MNIRAKFAAAAVTGAILTAGVVLASPANAADQVPCPSSGTSNGIEVWGSNGPFCFAGTPTPVGAGIPGSYEAHSGWNHGYIHGPDREIYPGDWLSLNGAYTWEVDIYNG